MAGKWLKGEVSPLALAQDRRSLEHEMRELRALLPFHREHRD